MTIGRKAAITLIGSLGFIANAMWPAAPIRSAITEEPIAGFFLQFSWSYLLFAPWTSAADYLTALSVQELIAWVITAFLVGLALCHNWKRRVVFVAGLLVFLAWAVLLPRPMGQLVTEDTEALILDFHSHTRVSHDGRPSFTPAKNLLWHKRQGFHAAFITDHNRFRGVASVFEPDAVAGEITTAIALRGEEASLYETHIGVYGISERIDNQPYDSDPEKIPAFIKDMQKKGYVVTLNLPEYWKHHWAEEKMDFLFWGADGFELANSDPRSQDFPEGLRRKLIDHCTDTGCFLTGVTDTHGYGYAAAAWSVMRIPNWRSKTVAGLERAVLRRLRRGGIDAVQVIERVKAFPETTAAVVFSPFSNLWIWFRTLGTERSLAVMGWFWLVMGWQHLIRWKRRHSREGGNPAAFM